MVCNWRLGVVEPNGPLNVKAPESVTMAKESEYIQAHLIVASIRVLDHQKGSPPAVDDICRLLNLSKEQGNLLCKKLQSLDIIDVIKGAYGERLRIKDHLKIESLDRGDESDGMARALENFHKSKTEQTKKFETLKAAHAEKKKDLFEEMQRKLKAEFDKQKKE
jgi:hypothetical protein